MCNLGGRQVYTAISNLLDSKKCSFSAQWKKKWWSKPPPAEAGETTVVQPYWSEIIEKLKELKLKNILQDTHKKVSYGTHKPGK